MNEHINIFAEGKSKERVGISKKKEMGEREEREEKEVKEKGGNRDG